MKWARLLCIGGCFLVMAFSAVASSEEGMASYYADTLHGNPTASGEPYDKDSLTAAHRTLPFGTHVKVTRLDNGESVEVRINDRGPHAKSRIIDLSSAAARKLGMIDSGAVMVKLDVQD